MKKKEKILLILKLLIVFLEIVGFFVTYYFNHKISYEYYTEDSNILALVSSGLYVFYIIRKKHIPRWLQLLKYTTTVCLTVTFCVVIFILAPMYHFNYTYLLFYHSLLYQHLLCPILSIITFLYLDYFEPFNKTDTIISTYATVIYAIVLILLNIIGIVEGPYPFLMVRNQTILMSTIWLIVILGITYFIAFILRKKQKS